MQIDFNTLISYFLFLKSSGAKLKHVIGNNGIKDDDEEMVDNE